jgi:hypothetical protein
MKSLPDCTKRVDLQVSYWLASNWLASYRLLGFLPLFFFLLASLLHITVNFKAKNGLAAAREVVLRHIDNFQGSAVKALVEPSTFFKHINSENEENRAAYPLWGSLAARIGSSGETTMT